MPQFRFSKVAIITCFVLFFLNLLFSSGQDIPAMPTAENDTDSITPFNISVNVNEVRLDVVVVDGRGRPITDLTADDFEIYQDKRQQEITSGIYIENQANPSAWPSVQPKDSKNLPRLPATALKEEEVRRTIVFLVDDTSIRLDELHNAKMSIGHFLDKQMLPGDLVAVMRTSSGNSIVDMFSSEKRLISAIVNDIRPSGFLDPLDDDLYRVYESQLLALSYSIRSLKDMPGRKILFFLTNRLTIRKPPPVIFGIIPVDYDELYNRPFNLLADEAMRAGVVVHMLDTKGLQFVSPGVAPPNIDGAFNPLPAKTGGIIVENQNFFLNGIGNDANNMIAGYYLVSYIPPPTTFDLDRYGRDVYHRVQVRVKRKGAVVYTREGFYGRAESDPAFTAKAHPLHSAIFSPFLNADIGVNMTAGYTKDDKDGYIVRAWVHLDPNDVAIAEKEDGGAVIKLDTLCLTTGANGAVYDERNTQYTFNITPENKSENLALIQKYGIKFSMLLPVKKPGAYSVRIAVQDIESGKVGSAYQFVEIPDLKKKKLALSDIFMITSDEDLSWLRSDVTKELGEGFFFPVMRKDETPSPALRTYMPGDDIQALTMIYNADPKAIARFEIKTQSVLYKDGEELLRSEPKPITPESIDSLDSLPILQKLTLSPDMQPGNYILQLRLIDKNDKKDDENKKESVFSKILKAYINEPVNYGKTITEGRTSQALSFRIVENSSQ